MSNKNTDDINDSTSTEAQELYDLDYKELYEKLVERNYEDLRARASDCLDFGERNKLWQNLEDNRGCTENVAGWLFALSLLSEMETAGQTKWEMSIACEHTQFAVELCNQMHDITSDIKKLAHEYMTVKSHYHAVLAGRRLADINYTSEEGDFVPSSALDDALKTSGARRFSYERVQREEEIRRRDPLLYCVYSEATCELIDELMTDSLLCSASDT
jgi:hypothetical protein